MATAEEIAADLEALALSAPERAHQAVVKFGAVLQTQVQRNASGRPGPNAVTGDYRRSITREISTTGTSSRAIISTNKPQAMRLELGFRGTDSLGRVWDQPPFPHFGPALDTIKPEFEKAMAEIVGEF